MARIGFIGASGLMGHGIAKNLQLKGHELAFTVHRNRQAVADLLADGALEAKSISELASGSEIVFICVTGSPQRAVRPRSSPRSCPSPVCGCWSGCRS